MTDVPNINTWSWVTGAIGLVTVLPLLYAIIMAHLPASQIKALEEALADTNQLLETVIEKGLLSDKDYVNESKRKLVSIESQASDMKMSAYCAETTSQQIRGLLSGLSYNIHCLCRQVKRIRADISKTTSEERRRLETGDSARQVREDDAIQPLWSLRLSDAHRIAHSDHERQSVDIADLTNPAIRMVELPYDKHALHVYQSIVA